MENDIQKRIDKIVHSGSEVPAVIKETLSNTCFLCSGKAIIDFVYLAREYYDSKEKEVYQNASLLVITESGVLYVEEGKDEIDISLGGYYKQFIPLDKIISLKLNSVLLNSVFTIDYGSSSGDLIEIRFNRGRHFEEFERLSATIRQLL